ncbi:hypothetical protein R1sor_023155 [Riccia sorocarpa]|uniref:Uncharacterized protein n=1 Tax=Riccia sorocarpa TaxID=122646 RepID=A0ABD3GR15_9MARC
MVKSVDSQSQSYPVSLVQIRHTPHQPKSASHPTLNDFFVSVITGWFLVSELSVFFSSLGKMQGRTVNRDVEAARPGGEAARGHEGQEQGHGVDPGGRTYYISIPVRPLTADVPEEHLERLTLYYTLYGAVFGVVGALAIALPLLTGLAVTQIIPWLLILGGAVTLLQFLLICGAPGTTAFLLLAILHLGVGIWMMMEPIAGTTEVTFVIAAWFIVHGVIKLVMACQVRKLTTWPAVLASGLASIILAFVVTALTPRYGLTLVGITFGSDLLVTGIALLLIALMAFLGKQHRSITDADLPYATKEPLLGSHGHAAASSA